MRHDPGTRDTRGESGPPDLSARLRRRRAARSFLESTLVSTAMVVAYFVLPFDSSMNTSTVLVLFLGLVLVVAVLTWHIRGIIRSPYPRVRTVNALATTLPLFLVVFAATYFEMEGTTPGSFSETLSKLDAVYFTVTVFATVGFGDITPVSTAARSVTTLQMVGDVILVGLVAHVIVGAMREGLRRQGVPDDLDRDRSS